MRHGTRHVRGPAVALTAAFALAVSAQGAVAAPLGAPAAADREFA
jgi:hypothetical protein